MIRYTSLWWGWHPWLDCTSQWQLHLRCDDRVTHRLPLDGILDKSLLQYSVSGIWTGNGLAGQTFHFFCSVCGSSPAEHKKGQRQNALMTDDKRIWLAPRCENVEDSRICCSCLTHGPGCSECAIKEAHVTDATGQPSRDVFTAEVNFHFHRVAPNKTTICHIYRFSSWSPLTFSPA